MSPPAALLSLFAGVALLLAAAACGGTAEAPTPSPTPTVVATAAPTATASATATATPAPASLDDLARAVVQIFALRETGTGYEKLWSGSGTIIDPSGLILTNYHVVEEEAETERGESIRWDELGVALTLNTDQPPERTYFAQVLAQDPLLDLAIIQPYADDEGNPIDPSTLNLPTIPLGEAAELTLGQELNILGYPGIGGDTITFTTGQVAGFLSQEGVTDRRAWIKTDATAAPGNSGGAALDAEGQLIGVPTRATIDVGGFINRVRPVDLASEVIQRARAGEFVARGQRTRPAPTPQAGQVFITNLVFARDVTDDGELVDIVYEFPAGTEKLVFSFDYAGMQDGLQWVDEWYQGGALVEELSGPRPPWHLGESGAAWASVEPDEALEAGRYDLEIFVEGELVATAITYIGREAVGPSVAPIAFAQDVSADDTPIGLTGAFPEGTYDVYAFFDYSDASTVGEFRWVWTWESPVAAGRDRVYESDRYPWEGGDSGNWWVGYIGHGTLPGGDYEFELYFDDEPVQTGAFTILGAAGEPDWPF